MGNTSGVLSTINLFPVPKQFHAQNEGLAMGFPLSPIAANIFMEALEIEALANIQPSPSHWYRYVDDTFVI
ncbi:hypothetical protein ANN_05708 [Periplaneta americana]|uniref:Reverse transcriptase domain-containing protein n=1 Tax=Periplaneta americana TaxID=6978 RepID=A0ABQ8TBJ2_PERAM|nr:hypothetical protein ANN_05708 [Periplaneta americana]